MIASPYQICRVKVRLGLADYFRPCVVLAVFDGSQLSLAAISSKMELYRPDQHFLIRDDHPDFAATGLSTTSYVVGTQLFDASDSEIEKVLGNLTGELAKEFIKWIG